LPSSADQYAPYNQSQEEGPGPVGYLALVLAWVVPGLGHIILRQWARGIVFFLTIHLLFAGGLFLAGIRAINPSDQAIWTYTQALTGWPWLVANRAERTSRDEFKQLLALYDRQTPPNETIQDRQIRTEKFIQDHPLFAFHPKIQDLGAVYCGIAGMLNLLIMFDVLLRITGSTREVPAKSRRPAPLTAYRAADAAIPASKSEATPP
jgi:hypothetical protein